MTFNGESAGGWQRADFDAPVHVRAGSEYVVSYVAPNGHAARVAGGFASVVTRGVLTAPAGPANGVLHVGGAGFPEVASGGVDFGVDVVFSLPRESGSVFDHAPSVAAAEDSDSEAVEVGMKFRAARAARVTQLRFFKPVGNAGPHVGSLWRANGTLLARVTFTGESAYGWQSAALASPVALAANTTYVVSYHAPHGHYAAITSGFDAQVDSGLVRAPASSAVGGNGVFAYGPGPTFPSGSWRSTNYLVDVVVEADAPVGGSGAAPTAPSNVVAVLDRVQTGHTTLSGSWARATDPSGDLAEHQYCISRSEDCSWGIFRSWTRASDAMTLTPIRDLVGSDEQAVHLCVRARDHAGNTGPVACSQNAVESSEPPTDVDETPPLAPVIASPIEGASLPEGSVAVSWLESFDADSGIAGYEYRVARVADIDATSWTATTQLAASATLAPGTYAVDVRAVDRAGNRSVAARVGFVVTAPEAPVVAPVVRDGVEGDIDSVRAGAPIDANWDAVPHEDGIARYEWCLASSPGPATGAGCDLAPWLDAGRALHASRAFPAAAVHGSRVVACVRAVASSEMVGEVGCSNGATVDAGGPDAIGSVLDGAAGQDAEQVTPGQDLDARWTYASGTDAVTVQWCLASGPACDAMQLGGWRSAQPAIVTAAHVAWSSLPMPYAAIYRFCVRALDAYGNAGAARCSDGVTVVLDDGVEPAAPTHVVNGPGGEDRTWQGPEALVSWTASASAGVASYERCTAANATACVDDSASWVAMGSGTSASFAFALPEAVTCIRAVSVGGRKSEPACARSATRDAIAPTLPQDVVDGVGEDVDDIAVAEDHLVSWAPSEDSLSGLARYEVCVVSAQRDECGAVAGSVRSWTEVGIVASARLDRLPLEQGTRYRSCVRAIDNAGNASARTCSNGFVIRPVPSLDVPPLGSTAQTMPALSTRFLYEGPDAIQTGVAQGTIDPAVAAVIRGRVLDPDGAVVAGASVHVLDHPEYGETVSRSDGEFDFAVNGGTSYVVVIRKVGYPELQRRLSVKANSYEVAEDVALTPLDDAVTSVDTSAPGMTIAAGSPVNDESGHRRSLLLFPQGVHGWMRMPDRSLEPLSTMHVRATEYTVGDLGPEAMPADIAANTAYTYAVEWSVDEALAAGATGVEFDQPVISYVDNFLHFPVGQSVPTGYYDRVGARWQPAPNGRIIAIVGSSFGVAEVDANGDGLADSGAQLAALGITHDELVALASTYALGAQLWRVPTDRFSPHDHNWYASPPGGGGGGARQSPSVNRPDCVSGSIIDCQNQVLGEVIPLPGTGMSLNYRSDQAIGMGSAYRLTIPIFAPDADRSGILDVTVRVSVAGQQIERVLRAGGSPESIPGSIVVGWGGRDAYGRATYGTQTATVDVGYRFDAAYVPAPVGDQTFGSLGPDVDPMSNARDGVTRWVRSESLIGRSSGASQGLGGWTISPAHRYDPLARRIVNGDGTTRVVGEDVGNLSPRLVTRVAGTNQRDHGRGDGPALQHVIKRAHSLDVAPDGSVLFVEAGASEFVDALRVLRSGRVSTVLPDIHDPSLSDDDSGRADLSWFQFGPNDSIYAVDQGVVRIEDGRTVRVAGRGDREVTEQPIPALEADLSAYIEAMSVDSDGRILLYTNSSMLVVQDGLVWRMWSDLDASDPEWFGALCVTDRFMYGIDNGVLYRAAIDEEYHPQPVALSAMIPGDLSYELSCSSSGALVVSYSGEVVRIADTGAQQLLGTGSWEDLEEIVLFEDGAYASVVNLGDRQEIRRFTPIGYEVMAGGVIPDPGEGVAAVDDWLDDYMSLAIDGEGRIVASSRGTIFRIGPDGRRRTLAGSRGLDLPYADFGDDASGTRMPSDQKIGVLPDGRLLYLLRGKIGTIDDDGRVRVWFDPGTAVASPNGAVVSDFAVEADGSVIAIVRDDVTWDAVAYRVSPGGTASLIAGCAAEPCAGRPTSSMTMRLDPATSVAVDPTGSVYFAQWDRIAVLDRTGSLRVNDAVRGVSGVAVDSQGRIFFTSYGHRISVLDRIEAPERLMYDGSQGPVLKDEASSMRTTLDGFLSSIVVAPDGSILVSARGVENSHIYRLTPFLPGYDGDAVELPSADGTTADVYAPDGRLLQSRNALTQDLLLDIGYDDRGRVRSLTDPQSGAVTVQRDASGAPLSVTGPDGVRTLLHVDERTGYLESVELPGGRSMRFEYDPLGLLTREVDPRGGEHRFGYDRFGRLTLDDAPGPAKTVLKGYRAWETCIPAGTGGGGDGSGGSIVLMPLCAFDVDVRKRSASGREVRFTVDSSSSGQTRVRAKYFPDGTRETKTEDALGNETVTDRFGVVTTTLNEPDPIWGDLVLHPATVMVQTAHGEARYESHREVESAPDGSVRLTTTSTTPSGTSKAVLDTAAHTLTRISPTGRVSTTTLDERNRRPIRVTGAGREPVIFAYDARSRLVSTTTGQGPGARTATTTWGAAGSEHAGLPVSVEDAEGRITTFSYNARRQLVGSHRTGARASRFEYDAGGVMTRMESVPGRVYDYENAPDELLAATERRAVGAAAERTEYSYNDDRELVGVDRIGNERDESHHYDSAGHLTNSVFGGELQEFAYSPLSLLMSASNANSRVSFGYEDGLVSSAGTQLDDGPVQQVHVDRDEQYRTTGIQAGLGTTAYTYNAEDEVQSAGDLQLQRAPQSGDLVSTSIGHVVTAHATSTFGEYAGSTASVDGVPVWSQQLERDRLGRITSITGRDGWKIEYDGDDQLASVDHGDGDVETYGYDGRGNRTSVTRHGVTRSASFDADDRLTAFDGHEFEHDQYGARTSDVRTASGARTRYAYDTRGNLASVTLPSGVVEAYVTDALGRRVAVERDGVVTDRFAYVDSQQLVAWTRGGETSTFVYATGGVAPDLMRTSTGRSFRFVTDHLGSVRLVVDTDTGEVVQRLDYSPWGEVVTDTNPGFQPFGYTGGTYRSTTGLVHLAAREYDPATAQFLQRDPSEHHTGDPYTYAGNDPVNFVDPGGQIRVPPSSPGQGPGDNKPNPDRGDKGNKGDQGKGNGKKEKGSGSNTEYDPTPVDPGFEGITTPPNANIG